MNGSMKHLLGYSSTSAGPGYRPMVTSNSGAGHNETSVPPRTDARTYRAKVTSMITEPERGDTFAAPNYQQFKSRSARAGSGDGRARGVQFPPSFSPRKAK